MSKNIKHKKIYRFIYAIFITIFIACGIYISLYFYQGYKYDQELSSYLQVTTNSENNSPVNDKRNSFEKEPLYNKLKTINSDLVAILSVENYTTPIVQTVDNDFYLKKNIEKKYTFHGTPFLDCNNNSAFNNQNNIVYGHNMGDGKCFGYLKKIYTDRNNCSLELDLVTDSKKYKGSLVSCIYTSSISDIDYQQLLKLEFETDEFVDYLKIINDKSYLRTEQSLNQDDKVLTLYTCSYNQQNSKLLMIFKLIEM